MAEKRMLSNKIISSDAFSNLSLSAQALYLHLNMNADDDGIVDSPHRTQRAIGATDEAFQELIEKRFILIVEGVTVIKHWHINNNIRSEKKAKSAYPEIIAKLKIKENGAYTLADNGLPTGGTSAGNGLPIGGQTAAKEQPTDSQKAVQNSIVKNSIDYIYSNRACAYEEPEPEPEEDQEDQPDQMAAFNEFWQIYPYKVSRITAEQAWARLNPSKELAAEIIAGVKKHRDRNESWRRDKGRYIPKPDTFLTDQRWRDELPEELPELESKEPDPKAKAKTKPGTFGDFPQRDHGDDYFAELEKRKIKGG